MLTSKETRMDRRIAAAALGPGTFGYTMELNDLAAPIL